MMNINQAKHLPPGSVELAQEIEDRRKMVSEMVGTLYPSILEDEMILLHRRYIEVPMPEMDPIEKSNRIIEAKNRIHSNLIEQLNKEYYRLTLQMNCNHSWRADIGGYKCSYCSLNSGDYTELNTMIAHLLILEC